MRKKLIKALKENPELIIPGKVRRLNVVQNEIPSSILASFGMGLRVVFVFDTDTAANVETLKKNIHILKKLKVTPLTVPQVLNFEDEIVRCTDVKKAPELTKSGSIKDFKREVNRIHEKEFRNILRRHKFDVSRLWTEKPPKAFSFVQQDGDKVKSSEKGCN